MTEPRPKALTPSFGDYQEPQNVKQDLHALYRDAQPKRGRILSAAPIATDLQEGEFVWVDDESSVRRGYVKLNGTLRYWDLT